MTAGIMLIATGFTISPIMTGTEWAAFVGGIYGVFNAKDGYLKGKNGSTQ